MPETAEREHLARVKAMTQYSPWLEQDVARLMYSQYWNYETGTFKQCRDCDAYLVPWSVDGRLLTERVYCPEHTR